MIILPLNGITSLKGVEYNELFKKEFGQVGYEGMMLIKETNSKFALVATGRANCIGLQATLDLKKRHDLTQVLWNIFRSSKDVLNIEIALDSIDPFVFALVPSTEEKRYKKEVEDIKLYALPSPKLAEEYNIPERFSVLTDCKQVVPIIFTTDVVKTLHECEHLIELIHFTDQCTNPKYKHMLKFQFLIPKDKKELKTLLQMALYFIDAISEINLPPQAIKIQRELRYKAVIVKSRETKEEREEAKERKLEEKRKKRER